jgi:general secretion pathway protein C
MKRLPIVLSLLAMVVLASSIAYWVIALYHFPQRSIVAPPQAALPDPPVDAAATLFGGQAAAAVATNYTLTGVVADGGASVAIIVAEGSPPKALTVGKELVPGVTLAEVHPRYVMLSDGGVMKRIDLPAEVHSGGGVGAPAPVGGSVPPNGEPPVSPGPVQTQEAPAEAPPPQAAVPPAGVQPGAQAGTQAGGAVGAQPAPPPAPVQMPPPVRPSGSPVRPPPSVQ